MRHEIIFSKTQADAQSYWNVQKQSMRVEALNQDLCEKPSIEYLIANEVDCSYGVWVNSVGRQKVQPNMTYPPRNHPSQYYFNVNKGRTLNEYQLVYITDGCGEFFPKKNETGIKVKGGTLLWIIPGQWHSYCPSSRTGWNEYYIGFNGEVIDKLTSHSFLEKLNKSFEIGFNEELATLFIRALEIAHARNAGTQQYLSGIVLHMLGLVMSLLKEEMSNDINKQKIEQAKIIMTENVYLDLDLRELSASLNISYSWFRKLFKDYTGYGPAKYLLNLKIEKVKELLATTDMPVKELLYILNYNTIENFYSAFKKCTGYTPMEYRHLVQERRTAI